MYNINHKVLSKDETNSLVLKAQEGCNESRDKLILSNVKLVSMVAHKYKNTIEVCSVEDLVQEGLIGLSISIDRFDINKEASFSTYSLYWIKKYIIKHLRETKSIRLPGWIYEQNIEEHINKKVDSLDIEVFENTTRYDLIVNENIEIEKIVIKDYVDRLISSLNEKEQYIIKHRMQEKPLWEIGMILGLSRERIRQMETEAHRKMKKKAKDMEKLGGYNEYRKII